MRMKFWVCLFFLLAANLLSAQNSCVSELMLQEKLAGDAAFAARFSDNQKAFDRFLNHQNHLAFRSTLVVPVVVHVVWYNEAQNISDEQIHSQIAVLNADFRALNCEIPNVPAEFQPLIADMEIEFCLASVAPDGGLTSGITRTPTHLPRFDRFSKSIFHADRGGADAWDTEHYLNIWIAPLGGTLGFAVFPGSATSPEEDGIVIDPNYFGTIGLAENEARFNLGRTATHEIGHYLNLLHTFGDEGENACDEDDGVEDTPLQGPANFGDCPHYPQVSCGSSDMFMNFMNFANDACLAMFSAGQKARVWAAIQFYRPDLLESGACGGQTPGEPVFEFSLAPNPARNYFQLIPKSAFFPKGHLRVFDMTGRIILEAENFPIARKIEAKTWQSGVYIVEITCAGKRWLGKLVR